MTSLSGPTPTRCRWGCGRSASLWPAWSASWRRRSSVWIPATYPAHGGGLRGGDRGQVAQPARGGGRRPADGHRRRPGPVLAAADQLVHRRGLPSIPFVVTADLPHLLHDPRRRRRRVGRGGRRARPGHRRLRARPSPASTATRPAARALGLALHRSSGSPWSCSCPSSSTASGSGWSARASATASSSCPSPW